jgi:hypothetical protein
MAAAGTRTTTRIRRFPVPAAVPTLASKITAPTLSAWAIERPRIIKLIAQGTRWCPQTIVSKPSWRG